MPTSQPQTPSRTRAAKRAAPAEEQLGTVVEMNHEEEPEAGAAQRNALGEDDINRMTVVQLREALERKGLSSEGLKSVLRDRLADSTRAVPEEAVACRTSCGGRA